MRALRILIGLVFVAATVLSPIIEARSLLRDGLADYVSFASGTTICRGCGDKATGTHTYVSEKGSRYEVRLCAKHLAAPPARFEGHDTSGTPVGAIVGVVYSVLLAVAGLAVGISYATASQEGQATTESPSSSSTRPKPITVGGVVVLILAAVAVLALQFGPPYLMGWFD